ncbi:MAG: dihydrolipoyl dehydrogenase [Holosporales bacterium]
MVADSFDLVVVGAGPGGYVAAIRAAQLGKKVAVVEEKHFGGICLNWGCIPTKALLRSAEVYDLMRHAKDYGLRADNISFDLKAVVQRSRGVASQLSKGIEHLLKKNKITSIKGRAKIAGKGKDGFTLEVTGDEKRTLLAPKVILATGARARALPGFEADGKHIWTYKEAMVPETMPKSLLVVGSGAIGIEFASFYRSMGADVTVVEVQDRILPNEDAEISSLAHKAFEKRGLILHTKTTVKSLQVKEGRVTATLEAAGKAHNITVDRVILAVGIVANSENLGLEHTAVKLEKNHVVVGSFGETAEPGLYAIGDLAGAPWLAHKASHEGILAVEHMFGLAHGHGLDRTRIPGCTYSHPQIASIGLTEAQAQAEGRPIKVGRFPFVGNGKAIALGEPEGLVKTIFDEKTGELLGAHMIGAEVTELIQGYAIAMSAEATEGELMHTVFPHPTLSEMMHEATLSAYGRAIHF